jgi:hypothetical protein
VGLILIIAGVLAHITAMIAAGAGVLIATLLVSGVAVFTVEIRGQRRERQSAHRQHPHAP